MAAKILIAFCPKCKAVEGAEVIDAKTPFDGIGETVVSAVLRGHDILVITDTGKGVGISRCTCQRKLFDIAPQKAVTQQ